MRMPTFKIDEHTSGVIPYEGWRHPEIEVVSGVVDGPIERVFERFLDEFASIMEWAQSSEIKLLWEQCRVGFVLRGEIQELSLPCFIVPRDDLAMFMLRWG